MDAVKGAADFDGIAGAYRWMEYASLGRLLERVRWWWLDEGRLRGARHALVLGDGDGRFTGRLLRTNGQVCVTAIDLSSRMLGLLKQRCRAEGERLRTLRADVRDELPETSVDLVVTHFLLDCLTDAEVAELAGRVRELVQPGAVWVVSEFAAPAGLLHWPARALVRSLYFAFRVLTGLRVTRLPDHAAALRGCGFRRQEAKAFLGGVLVTEIWRLD